MRRGFLEKLQALQTEWLKKEAELPQKLQERWETDLDSWDKHFKPGGKNIESCCMTRPRLASQSNTVKALKEEMAAKNQQIVTL